MEAEINFDKPIDAPGLANLPSLSAQSSVDDLIVEQKFQHKKKLICISVLIIASLIVAGVLLFGAHEATNGFDFDSNTVTADMVLPNTTLTIEKVSSPQSKGAIKFQPHSMEFKWESLYNKTHDYIKFTWNNDNLNSEESLQYYNTYLNGVSGFMIDLKGNDDLTTNPSYINSSSIETLTFYVYKFDTNTPDEVKISSDNAVGTISEEEQNTLNLLINGYVGQYFSELSFKLGSLEYIGDEHISIKFIHNYAKFFYTNADNSNTANWNFTALEEATELTNIIVLYNGTQVSIDPEEDQIDGDASSRRLLSDPECCPSPGHKSANPYSRCGNSKFGMCGKDTSCWSWYCGTCQCVDECHEHDWYCSCDDFWGFWCINVFWVGCSDQCWWV